MSEVLFHAGDMKRIKRYGKALESTSHSNHLQKSLMFYTQNYSVPVSREDIERSNGNNYRRGGIANAVQRQRSKESVYNATASYHRVKQSIIFLTLYKQCE